MNCDQQNNQNVFDCALTIFEARANCSFPWNKNQSGNCTLNKLTKELKKAKSYEECSLDNCMREYFKPELLMELDYLTSTTTFGQYSDEADVIEEYFLMDLSSLLSAIGGDLGLIIGAGILTLFELIIDAFYSYRQRSEVTSRPTQIMTIQPNPFQ